MKKTVIIVAGGVGSRMKSPIPKQFLLLNDKPILFHTIDKFINYYSDIKIILVLPQEYFSYWNELCIKHDYSVKVKLIAGGEQRFYSVKNAIETINEDGLVAIHDGVRALVSVDTIKRCFDGAKKYQACIPVIKANDSIRQIIDTKNIIIDRSQIRLVQTPQCFIASLLINAYKQKFKSSFTDDASVVESYGKKIFLVDGNEENIKITRPIDINIAKSLL